MTESLNTAISIVGRHNSGKTTLIEKLIVELVGRGLDVGSVKHHTNPDFEIDVPGKDSWRHSQAGTSETVIATPGKIACVKKVSEAVGIEQIIGGMANHDVVLVEGYRHSGLPTIEVMRAESEEDTRVARALLAASKNGLSLEDDLADQCAYFDVPTEKMPVAATVAFATDISEAMEAASIYGIPVFSPDDIAAIADFVIEKCTR